MTIEHLVTTTTIAPQITVESVVIATDFSTTIDISTSKDEHLVPKNHTVFRTTHNVELSIQSPHPVVAGINSPSSTIAEV